MSSDPVRTKAGQWVRIVRELQPRRHDVPLGYVNCCGSGAGESDAHVALAAPLEHAK